MVPCLLIDPLSHALIMFWYFLQRSLPPLIQELWTLLKVQTRGQQGTRQDWTGQAVSRDGNWKRKNINPSLAVDQFMVGLEQAYYVSNKMVNGNLLLPAIHRPSGTKGIWASLTNCVVKWYDDWNTFKSMAKDDAH